ncbi:hypothetical protein KUTeg_001454 [Tegillarca granosa]|uniref:Uncharacterized protein n=1 Tax=Tegillarca granosa TaxID=220873 RepID=A0ABQ9FRG1_TEGGR|nr:hypothetical protein KUTeg_001454 [Tegillarca granosa]
MTRTPEPKIERPSIYTERVTDWTNKELQLNRLHEEILAKRESLLNCSLYYLRQQHARQSHASDAYVAERRNNKFLQDIITTQTTLQQEADNPPSPRLTTLLVNYWSMVRSMKPVWDETLNNRTATSTPRNVSQSSTVHNHVANGDSYVMKYCHVANDKCLVMINSHVANVN